MTYAENHAPEQGTRLTALVSRQLTDPKKATIPHAILRQAMLNTVAVLTAYTKDFGATEPSLMK